MKTPPSKLKQRARDRKAMVRAQLRLLREARLVGPFGQENLDEASARRLADLERERRLV